MDTRAQLFTIFYIFAISGFNCQNANTGAQGDASIKRLMLSIKNELGALNREMKEKRAQNEQVMAAVNETRGLANDIVDLKNTMADLNLEINSLKDDILVQSNAMIELNNEIPSLKDKNSEIYEEISSLKDENTAMQDELVDLRKKIEEGGPNAQPTPPPKGSSSASTILKLKSEISAVNRTLTAVKSQCDYLQDDVTHFKTFEAEIKTDMKRLSFKAPNLGAGKGFEDINDEISTLKKKDQSLSEEDAKLRQEISAFKGAGDLASKQQLDVVSNDASRSINELKSSLEKVDDAWKSEVKQLKSQIETSQNSNDMNEHKVKAICKDQIKDSVSSFMKKPWDRSGFSRHFRRH